MIILLLLVKTSVAQKTGTSAVSFSLPSIALIAITGGSGKDVSLSYTAPVNPGNTLNSPVAHTSLWLNFTSAVGAIQTRKIQVQAESAIPAGLTLMLQLSGPSGSGAGVRGVASGSIVLSSSAQDIITGIKGAYTGTGSGNGFQMVYSTSISNFSAVRHQTAPITITYTYSDQ